LRAVTNSVREMKSLRDPPFSLEIDTRRESGLVY
jgi:hypothetical protein